MTQLWRSRPIVVSILAIALIAGADLFLPSASSSGPAISNSRGPHTSPLRFRNLLRVAEPADYDHNSEHVLVVPYYNLTGGWTSTVMLSNQAPIRTDVGVTLYSLDGQRLDVPPVTLEAHAAQVFDLAQWAPGGPFLKGSLKIRYTGKERQVSGVVRVEHAKRSLIFDEQFAEPKEYFKSSRLEGVWWRPTKKAEVSVVVSNTSHKPLNADVITYGSRQRQIGSDTISLAAWETRVINAKELDGEGHQTVSEIGGISVNHTGEPGAVFASVLIQEPSTGFSSIVELRDPQAAVSPRLDGAGLRIGTVAHEQLKQVAVARNVGDQRSVVSGRIVYTTSDGANGVLPIRDVTLEPGEATAVDLLKPIKKARLHDVVAAGLEFEYTSAPGSIVMSALSVSESGNHVFRVPLVDVQSQPSNTGKYHLKTNGGSSTVVYLKNATTEEQQYTLYISYPGGFYVQGVKKVEAGRVLVYDLRKLRNERVPDQDGNTIPAGVTEGYLNWSAQSVKNLLPGQMEGPEHHVMMGRAEQIDTTSGMSSTSTYGCMCSDSYAESWQERQEPGGSWTSLSPGGFTELYVGDTVQLRARQRNTDCYSGYGPAFTVPATWGSQNDPVAGINVDSGVATGVSPGSAQILGWWTAVMWLPIYECCEYYPEFAGPTSDIHVIGVTDVTATGAQRISSVVGNQNIIHFVTPKGGANDIVTLTATFQPYAPSGVTWEGATQNQSNPAVATVSKSSASKQVVKIKVGNRVLKELRVWTVWTTISSTDIAIQYHEPANIAGQTGAFIDGGYNFTHTIQPTTIITDANRPDLSGARLNAPPGGTHPIFGDPLSNGADVKWDNSRQIRLKRVNPNSIPLADLVQPPGPNSVSYPNDDVEGNDDRTNGDPETNDPYANSGVLTGTDSPNDGIAHSAGAAGNTYEMRYQFREFSRLEIQGTWYRISDYYLWRLHIKFKKVNGKWVNDGTVKALDNNDF